MTNHTNSEYWARQLQKTNDRIHPLLSKMYEEHCNLSIEDQYALRELLSTQAALIDLLNNDMYKPLPKTRRQKFFKK